MRARVIDGGRDAFNNMLYGVPDRSTLDWLDNSMSRGRELLGGLADHLVEASARLYHRVNGDAAVNAAKALVSEQGGGINQHDIYGLRYETMHEANYIMQQYIMANPRVQTLHSDNMCHGFEETYHDTEPGVTGRDRLDYQRVMNGVACTDADGYMYVDHYSSTDEIVLSCRDQDMILDTWQQVDVMLINDADPTDPEQGVF